MIEDELCGVGDGCMTWVIKTTSECYRCGVQDPKPMLYADTSMKWACAQQNNEKAPERYANESVYMITNLNKIQEVVRSFVRRSRARWCATETDVPPSRDVCVSPSEVGQLRQLRLSIETVNLTIDVLLIREFLRYDKYHTLPQFTINLEVKWMKICSCVGRKKTKSDMDMKYKLYYYYYFEK